MSGNLVFIARESELGTAVLTHLRKSVPHLATVQHSFETVTDHVVQSTEAALVVAVTTPGEAELAVRLVQEISIRKLMPNVVLLESKEVSGCDVLTHVQSRLAQRLRWPEGADRKSTRLNSSHIPLY